MPWVLPLWDDQVIDTDLLTDRPAWAVRSRPAATLGSDGRVLTGTAAALATALRVDPAAMRLALVVLTVAGGWGVIIYATAWLWFTVVSSPPPSREVRDDPWRDLGLCLVVLGLVFQARVWGWAFSDALVWPVVAIAGALGVAWRRIGDPELSVAFDESNPRTRTMRVGVGGLLVLGGTLSLIGADLTFVAWLRTLIGLVVVLGGAGIMFGPTLRGVTNALVEERRQRIRADERTVISSHLHDSVLQTLALIQKRADDPAEVQSLARRQERELRQWLFGEPALGPTTVRSALERVSAEVEDRHRVAVECVVVGDRPLDDTGSAIVAAAAEALVNAAKFSGEPRVSLYAEVGDESLDVFVRDRGVGFDPAAVDDDRRGIADSIITRVTRVGGTAAVHSAPGRGAEVELHHGTSGAI